MLLVVITRPLAMLSYLWYVVYPLFRRYHWPVSVRRTCRKQECQESSRVYSTTVGVLAIKRIWEMSVLASCTGSVCKGFSITLKLSYLTTGVQDKDTSAEGVQYVFTVWWAFAVRLISRLSPFFDSLIISFPSLKTAKNHVSMPNMDVPPMLGHHSETVCYVARDFA